VRIVLITDPAKLDYPDPIKDTYKKSLDSVAVSIAEAIKELGFELKHFKADSDLCNKVMRYNPDLVFNRSNLDHKNKEIAITPELLDRLGIPYTGPNAKNCIIAFNKYLTKTILRSLDIPTSEFVMITDPSNIQIPENMSFPLFIKPVTGGCSLGIEGENLVFREKSCRAICKNLINTFDRPVIVEEFLDGREFTVGLLGNDPPAPLPILEFINYAEKAYSFRSFTSKMIMGEYEQDSCPAAVSKKEKNEIIDLAVRAYNAIGCRDYARIDIRFDKDNMPHVLEVNAFPSLIPGKSSFAHMAEKFGLSFTELIREILTIASKRYLKN